MNWMELSAVLVTYGPYVVLGSGIGWAVIKFVRTGEILRLTKEDEKKEN